MTRHATRIAAAALSAIALGTGIGTVAAPAANAATTATSNGARAVVTPNTLSCYGYSCHGHDPVLYGCSVASTKTVSDGLLTLWNRYSLNCNANWGRAQLSSTALNAHDTLEVAITTTDSHGTYEAMCYPGPSNTGNLTENCTGSYGGSNTAYTDMVDGTNLTSAEAIVLNASGQQIDYLQVDQ